MTAVVGPVGELDFQVVPPHAQAVPAPADHHGLQVLAIGERDGCPRA
ncbi:hypothetical protein [Streptomyces lydicus]|nr:hypothetical protein [Streptomyces lydicus]